ncbi:MAG: hypothetical protein J2P15_03710, partial [Micromonosporaceae bacterium]|nr:hypothetical protein [Micromonosporaceae bacterium]
MKRVVVVSAVVALLAGTLVATSAAAGPSRIVVSPVVDVTADQTAQNETPVAVNPADPANIITGDNDWNNNDGCGVNASFDGGRSWTPTLPDGYLPGVTRFTNDPAVPGDGAYDVAGDPTIAFSPDGRVAYYVCQAFNLS